VGRGSSLPPELIAILNDGGLLPRLIREGYVAAPERSRAHHTEKRTIDRKEGVT
jgi:hypothetical protein